MGDVPAGHLMAYGFVESEGEILGLLDADERGVVCLLYTSDAADE